MARGESKPVTAGGVLRTLALAAGITLAGAYVLDWHRHDCECGHSWRHLGAFNFADEAAHTCARCGSRQWWKANVSQQVKDAHAAHNAFALAAATQRAQLAMPVGGEPAPYNPSLAFDATPAHLQLAQGSR